MSESENEKDRIITVMADNTKAKYIRVTNLSSTEVPPSTGVFCVDKVDIGGVAHVGKIKFSEGAVAGMAFSEVVQEHMRKLCCDKSANVPVWLTVKWIENAPVNFSDAMIFMDYIDAE